MSISIDPESGHDLSYSVHACGRCGAPMQRVPAGLTGRGWRCPTCGRRER